MTDPARWEEVKALLDRAMELAPDQRTGWVRERCEGDDDLLREVRSLLEAADPKWDPLEQSAANLVSEPDPDVAELEGLEGTRVGAYELTRLVGVGGMGVVYHASRIGEMGGCVAVKLIKRGMDSATVGNRFRHERQILARLTHPNIAHFLDGGVTDDGRAYFVMEFVEGESIIRFAERHDLSIETRIRLFLQVLEAVAFAHRNLVVHRDIKPSNILVTDGGLVKLLDFGVAKVLGDSDGPDVTLTQLGSRVLTPSYSSPEQIRGEPVSTAADVYSLGVVLYELFARHRPFDLDTVPLAEVLRVVSFEEPTRPSMAVSTGSASAGSVSRRLSRKLAGDLDTIVLKALRKEPHRRYASARELYDDLCRYLDGVPVLARRGSWSYRVGKWIRRYRTAVVAAVVLIAVTGVWGVVVARQAAQVRQQTALAEQRVEDVRTLVNTLLFDVHDRVAELPGSTGARKLILDKAYEQLATVEADVPDDPDLLIRLAEAYRRLGDVQGEPMGASLGDLSSARRSFEEGLSLAQRAVALAPADLVRIRSVGLLHERYAAVLAFSGAIDEGIEHARSALDAYRRIAEAFPDSGRHQLTYAIGLINLSDYLGHPSFPNLGRPEDAEAGYREVRARLNSGVLAADRSFAVRRYRGLIEERLARMLRDKGDLDGALDSDLASLRIRETLYSENPGNGEAHRDVGVSNQNVCSVRVLRGEFDQALARCDRARAIYEERLRRDPLVAVNLSDMALMNLAFGELQLAQGDTLAALAHLDRAIEWSDRRLERDPTSLMSRQNKLDALLTRALLQARRGDPVGTLADTRALVDALSAEGHLTAYDTGRYDTLEAVLARAGI